MSSRQEDLRSRLKAFNETDEVDEMPSRERERNSIGKLFSCCLCGVVFGIALEKGRVFEPHIIREQMVFTNFTMLKMFLSATAMGMLSFSVLTMTMCEKMDRVFNNYIRGIRNKTRLGAAVGGVILGSGMSIAGACPGMVLVQVGAMVPNAGYTLMGGFLGAFLYAITDPFLPEVLQSFQAYEHNSLDGLSHTPYFILGLPFASLLGLFVAAVEMYVPWYTEVEISGTGLFGSRAWAPFVTGGIVGLLQIPLVFIVEDTLGSASSYVTAVAQVVSLTPLRESISYLRGFTKGVANWWQVFFVGGAIFGGFLSATASQSLRTVSGVSPQAGLLGGTLMVYGARLAGGCTSGHGLSGMGLLVLLSFITVPAMFTGGFATAVTMKYGLGVEF